MELPLCGHPPSRAAASGGVASPLAGAGGDAVGLHQRPTRVRCDSGGGALWGGQSSRRSRDGAGRA